jgi:anti-anti-sigma factor
MATTPQLEREITLALTGHPRCLCLDLTELSFCDGTGLRALQRLSEVVYAAHVAFVLTGIHPNVHRTLGRLGAVPHGRPALPLD